MKLLLFSNSTNAGEEYFTFPIPYIDKLLTEKPQKGIFIPYAGVTVTYKNYFNTVNEKLSPLGIGLTSIHTIDDKITAIKEADLIVIGGGNTFQLLFTLQFEHLLEPIRQKVLDGTPYIGWSAGSNVTCPSIKTTNDMPIVEPESFEALNLVPFQINPHYTDANPAGHAGETREMRINEFIKVNQKTTVIGLREGSLLYINHKNIQLLGEKPARIFNYGKEAHEVNPNEELNFFLS